MSVRQAEPRDVAKIVRIIAHYAAQGLMLPRSASAVEAGILSYVVAENRDGVIACGGLQPYSADCAEIYGLATDPGTASAGTGRAIVESLIERACNASFTQVFALTLVPGFFAKMGFRTVAHRDLPMKVWKDCVACPKFGNCDEIAMVRDLQPSELELTGAFSHGRP